MPSGLPIPKLMRVLLLSLIVLFFPISWSLDDDGEWVIGADAARADDDDDDDDGDDDDDDGDEDDDDDGDEDDDDDDDDDDDGDDDDDDENGGGGSNLAVENGGALPQGSDQRVPENLHLRYPNGWDERIRNGRYILVDPEGRTVTNRRATMGDLDRMRDAAGL